MLHLGFSCRFPVHQHRVIFHGAFHHIIPPLYTTTNTILPSASAALLTHTRFCPATSPILFSFCNVTNSSFCPFSSLHHFQLFSHTSGFLFFTRLAQGSLMKCSRSSCQKFNSSLSFVLSCKSHQYPGVQPQLLVIFPDPWIFYSAI